METKIVALKGIVRNTAAAVSDDGAFDELMNLRHKDGSLKAIADNVEITWTKDEEDQELRPEHLADYVKMFVHNASNYKHLLGIRAGKLYWFATVGTPESSTDDYEATAIEETYLMDVATEITYKTNETTGEQEIDTENADKVFFSQIGNLICVADGERLKYLLYRFEDDSNEGAYTIADIDFNGKADATTLLPEGLIDLRVTADTFEDGRERVRYYRDITETDKPFYEGGMLDDDKTFQDEIRACIKANYARAFQQNAKDGRIDGWFLAVTALELYDGSTILMSRPVLCAQANDEGTRYTLDNTNDTGDHVKFMVEDQDVRKWNYKTHPFLMNAYLPNMTGELKDKRLRLTVNYGNNSVGTQRTVVLRNSRKDDGTCNDEYKFVDMPATFSGKFKVAASDAYNTTGDILELADGTQVLPLDTMTMIPDTEIEGAIFEYERAKSLQSGAITFRTSVANAVPTAAVRAKNAEIRDDNSMECCISNGMMANIGHAVPASKQEIYARDTMRLTSIPNAFAVYMVETKNTRHYDDYSNNATREVNINGENTEIGGTFNKDDNDASNFVSRTLVYPGYGDNGLGYGVVISCANKLQYRCNSSANDLYTDIVKSVNIYITEPVNSYDVNAPLNNIFYRDPCYRKDEPMGVCSYLTHKDDEQIIEELMSRSTFYKVKSIPYASITKGDWVDVDLKTGSILFNLVQQEQLDIDSMGRNNYVPQYVYTYNGKVHLANYKSHLFKGYPMGYLVQNYEDDKTTKKTGVGYIYDYATTALSSTSAHAIFHGQTLRNTWKLGSENVAYESDGQRATEEVTYNAPTSGVLYATEIDIATSNGVITVHRYATAQEQEQYTLKSLNPFISYPDSRATEIRFIIYNGSYYRRRFKLTAHSSFNFAYYVAKDLKPIKLNDCQIGTEDGLMPIGNTYSIDIEERPEYHPNGLKVSMTNNPFFFPNSATYQVGNGSIIAMAANTQALSTGQWGDAPLYVFCTDGIYALFVDSTGQLTYSNSRPISREICNNANSVTPIDNAIVFTTDRGLMLLSGSEATEISQDAEGKVYDMLNGNGYEHLLGLHAILNNGNHLTASLKTYIADKKEYAEYLKDVRIGYNYIERELYVTNPAYGYSYVYSNECWTKADKTCKYYVQDYPKTYAYNGTLKDLNVEDLTGNETCFVTRPIKFSSLGEKQNYRIVLRGNFVMNTKTITDADAGTSETHSKTACMIVYGSNDCNKWQVIGIVKRPDVPTAEQKLEGKTKCYDIKNARFRDLGCTLYSQQVKYIKIAFVADLAAESTLEHLEISVYQPQDKLR